MASATGKSKERNNFLPLNSNNTEDLKLDAVEQAEETVHLASADEHRTFFPTNNKMQLVLNVDHSLQYQFVAINH